MTSPLGRQISLQLAFQSTFDAYPTSPTWQPLTCYSDSVVQAEGFEDDPVLGRALNNGRDPYESAPALPVTSGAIEVPLCLREIGFWLKNCFGAPVTTGSDGDYVHTFSSGAAAIPPVTTQSKISAADWRRKRGLKVNQLSIRAEKTAGYPRVTLTMLGRDEMPAAAALSGTVADPLVLLRPPAARPVVRWGGTAIDSCLSATLDFTNGLDPANYVNGTEFPSELDPGAVNVGGALTMRYQDATWVNLAAAGTAGLLEIEWADTADPGARLITFSMPAAKLKKKGVPFTGPGPIQGDFEFRAEQGAAAPALQVILKTDQASY